MKIKRTAALLIIAALIFSLLAGCSDGGNKKIGLGNGWQPERSMELEYAKNFNVDYYRDGYKLITVSDESRFLVVPEGREVPEGIDKEIGVLKQPLRDVYLVATSAMGLFDALDCLGSITLSGTKADDWYIGSVKAAMNSGAIKYAGKYSAPDYELIVSSGCSLAIESTMIGHTPEVKEKLNELGIPVLIDQSSYEAHPLGRTEWIKLYAAILGKEEAAGRIFDQQVAYVDAVSNEENTGKTVAFFFISSSGYVVTRKSGDYITKMIELAGGNYIFKDLGDPDSALGTVNIEIEKFYAGAKDADFIIYNSAIVGELTSLEELIAKNSLLKDFKAVKNGDVWCTDKNLFQETTQHGLMIKDIHQILTNTDPDLDELNYMYKLK